MQKPKLCNLLLESKNSRGFFSSSGSLRQLAPLLLRWNYVLAMLVFLWGLPILEWCQNSSGLAAMKEHFQKSIYLYPSLSWKLSVVYSMMPNPPLPPQPAIALPVDTNGPKCSFINSDQQAKMYIVSSSPMYLTMPKIDGVIIINSLFFRLTWVPHGKFQRPDRMVCCKLPLICTSSWYVPFPTILQTNQNIDFAFHQRWEASLQLQRGHTHVLPFVHNVMITFSCCNKRIDWQGLNSVILLVQPFDSLGCRE